MGKIILAISAMKKDEIRKELEEYDVMFSSKDTVPELAAMLREAREMRKIKTSKKESKDSEDADPLKGISALTKAELRVLADDAGIPWTEHTTRDSLIVKLKTKSLASSTSKDTDLVNIGKHADRTYIYMKTHEPEYCNWVRETCEEEGARPHPRLLKFYRYIRENPVPRTPPVSTARASMDPPLTPRTIERVRQHLLTEQSGGGTGSGYNAMRDGTKRVRQVPAEMEHSLGDPKLK